MRNPVESYRNPIRHVVRFVSTFDIFHLKRGVSRADHAGALPLQRRKWTISEVVVEKDISELQNMITNYTI